MIQEPEFPKAMSHARVEFWLVQNNPYPLDTIEYYNFNAAVWLNQTVKHARRARIASIVMVVLLSIMLVVQVMGMIF